MSKFLIVDNNKDIQFLLQKIMERHDHEVVLADNGTEALEKARHSPPDIIVSDILMPVMDGFTLCSRWKNDDILKKIPFVFYTATYTDEKDEEAAFKAGADRFLRKSLTTEEFMDAVMDVINNAEHVRVITATPDQETEVEESYKLYNDRLVRKLEEKTLALEQEISRHRQTAEDRKLNQIELEMQNEELRKTHKMLETSRSRYADLYDYAPVGYFSFDKKGVILDVNLTCTEMLGIERSSLIKKTFSSFVVRDDQDILYLHCKEALKSGTSTCNLRIARNDGSEFLAQLESIGVKESEGNCNHCRTAITDITARKKADMHLKEQRNILDNIINATQDLMVLKDRYSVYQHVNSAFCRFLGKQADEIIGKTDFDLFPPEEAEMYRADDARVLETGKPQIQDEKVTGKESIKWLRVSKTPVLNREGATIGILCSVHDITERIMAEHATRESEEKYRAHFDEALDGIVIAEAATGIIVDCNPAMLKLVGREKSELINKHQKILHPEEEHSKTFSITCKKHLKENADEALDSKLITKDGQIKTVSIKAKKFVLQGKEVMQGIFRDVTERRQAEDMLKKSEFKYNHLYNNLSDAAFIISMNGGFLDVNEVAIKRLGYSREELLQMTPNKINTPEHATDIKNRIDQVKQNGHYSFETIHVAKDGKEIPTEISASLIQYQGETVIMALARDITDRKKAEEEIRKNKKQYRELVEYTHAIHWELDLATVRFTYVSPQAERILGYPVEDWTDYDFWVDHIHPDDREWASKFCNEAVARSEDHDFIYRMIAKDSKVVWIRDIVNVVSDSNGPFKLQGIMFNITERKQIEEELRQHREQLESLIKERTLELSASNEKLRKEIDERKEAEKALQDSEEKYRAFFEQAPDSVCLIDAATGNILTFNDKTHENLGYSREEFKELKISDFEVIESEEDVKDHIKQILEHGHGTFETRHRKKNGQIRNVLVSTKFIPVGEKKFIQSIWTDITDIKQTENQLKLMALFAELNPSPVLRFNKDGEVLMANPSSLKTFGRESLTGVPLKSVLPGIEKLDLISCIQNGTILSHPTHIGSRFFHFTLRGVPSMDIGHMYGDDITELRQAEGALLKSEDRYRRITEAITDYIYTVHIEEGRPVNTVHGENCLAITGYTKEEFSDDHYLWIHMVLEEDHELVLQQVDDVLAGNFPQSIQHRIVRKDGEIRWVESMMVPNYDFNGDLISYDGLIRDITTRKRLEEQLVHSQKMESIGTLAGGVAHDFNNILTAIIGFSSILTRKIPEDNPSRFYIDQIQLAAESAANLTGSLLAFGRKQKINPMPLNVNMMIKKVEKLLSRLIREDIVFRTVALDENLNVMADFSQMQQVLMNLVSNARDAMPEGGLLLLTSESFRIDNEFVRSRCFGKPGEYVLIAISDTGIGIDEMSKEKIFEPFYTSKETNKGTGLGLSIVYGIIKQHKGYIEVDSKLDKGTTVKIYLPMIETGKDKSIEQITEVIPRGGRETVLLVEDNSMIRQFLTSELTEFGYSLIVAKDGEEALYKFREHKDDIQFLITDVIMPKKSGKEVYAEIKKIRPDIKALFLSGYSEEMLKNESVLIKEINFMPKPVKPYDLLKRIREILDEAK